MPQKTIIVGMLCLTMLLTVWVLHASPCEFRVRFMWSEIAAFLQCKPYETAAGVKAPAIRLPEGQSKVAPCMQITKKT